MERRGRGKKATRSLRRKLTSLRNPDTCPNQRNVSITLACRPTQRPLARWNPPQRLLSTSDLPQWDTCTEDISRGASSWCMGASSWILSLLN